MLLRSTLAVLLSVSLAHAEIVYIGGAHLAEGFVDADPGVAGGPDDFFTVTAGPVHFDPGRQEAEATRKVPGGQVRTSAKVGVFRVLPSPLELRVEIEASLALMAPSGASGQIFTRGISIMHFSVEQDTLFELRTLATNVDPSAGAARSRLRITTMDQSHTILAYDVLHDAAAQAGTQLILLSAGSYSVNLNAEVQEFGAGPVDVMAAARVELRLAVVTTGACCFGSACADGVPPEACASYVCDVATLLPETFDGCYGDADGNGVVNAGDRGFVGANTGLVEPNLICTFDMDGNGSINAGDRGFVAANVGQCAPLPDWQNGSGLNHGEPDTRFATATFLGLGSTCAAEACPQ